MTDIAGGLITLEYASTGLQYKDVGAGKYVDRDADVTTYVKAATPVIEDIVGSVLPVSKTRTFDGGGSVIILNDRVQSITSVTESGVTSAGFTLDPIAGLLYAGTSSVSRTFTPGVFNVVVTYLAGMASVPQTLQLAARELVRFWVQQGMQSQAPQFGDGVESMSYTPQGFAVPKRVMELCAPYQAIGGFA
jgi:hypothetical protein